MKVRVLAFATLLSILANIALFASTPDDRGKKAGVPARNGRLVSLLPASDAVMTFDTKKFLTDGLPRVLQANSGLLGKVTSGLDEIQTKTGIDLRKFDEVSVGVTITQNELKKIKIDGVALASGDINAAAMIAVAKLASKGAYREEKIAGRTVYIFAVKDAVNNTTANTKHAAIIDDVVNHMTTSIAVAAYDQNLLVIGSLARVRETLEGTTHPAQDIAALLQRNPTAVMNFAVKTPTGFEGMLPLSNDELGKNIRSIRYMAGSMDLTPAGGSLSVMARTTTPEQANGLKATVDGLQLVGTALLGGGSSPSKQVYSRMIKSAKFGQTGSDVTLDLLVPQADIDTLIAGIK